MKWLHQKRLQQLLSKSSQHNQRESVQSAYKAMKENYLVRYETGKELTKNLLEIYERRSKYEKRTAQGFETVLPTLRTSEERDIRIHGFEANDDAFVFFTDVTTTKLLGIIRGIPGTRKIGTGSHF